MDACCSACVIAKTEDEAVEKFNILLGDYHYMYCNGNPVVIKKSEFSDDLQKYWRKNLIWKNNGYMPEMPEKEEEEENE